MKQGFDLRKAASGLGTRLQLMPFLTNDISDIRLASNPINGCVNCRAWLATFALLQNLPWAKQQMFQKTVMKLSRQNQEYSCGLSLGRILHIGIYCNLFTKLSLNFAILTIIREKLWKLAFKLSLLLFPRFFSSKLNQVIKSKSSILCMFPRPSLPCLPHPPLLRGKQTPSRGDQHFWHW